METVNKIKNNIITLLAIFEDINLLQIKIDQNQKTISYFTNEMNTRESKEDKKSLENLIFELDKEIYRDTAELSELKKKYNYQDLINMLHELCCTVANLNPLNNAIGNCVMKVKSKITDLFDNSSTDCIKCEKILQKFNILNSEYEHVQTSYHKLIKDHDKNLIINGKFKSELQRYITHNKNLEFDINNYIIEINELKHNRDNNDEKNDQKNNLIDNLVNENKDITDRLNCKIIEYDNLNDKLEKINNYDTKKIKELEMLCEQSNETFKLELDEEKKRNVRLGDKINSLVSAINELNITIHNNNKNIDNLTEENNNLKQSIDIYNNINNDLNVNLTNKCEELNKSLDQANKSLTQANDEISINNMVINSFENEVKLCKQYISELEQDIKELEKESVKNSNFEKESKKKEMEFITILHEKNTEIDIMSITNDHLTRQTYSLNEKINSCGNTIKELENQNKILLDLVEQYEKECIKEYVPEPIIDVVTKPKDDMISSKFELDDLNDLTISSNYSIYNTDNIQIIQE